MARLEGILGEKNRSRRELELFKLMKLFFDPSFVQGLPAFANPAPLLQQQFASQAIRLHVDDGHDFAIDQHRKPQVPEDALFFGYIGFKQMLVTELNQLFGEVRWRSMSAIKNFKSLAGTYDNAWVQYSKTVLSIVCA